MDCMYVFSKNLFNKLPNLNFIYYINSSILKVLEKSISLGNAFDVKKGADTGDNSFFLRFWWEPNKLTEFILKNDCKKWVPYAKGGPFRKWYGNNEYVIRWNDNGDLLKKSSANLRSPQLYFKESITWCALTSGTCSFRFNNALGLFDSAGSSMFPNNSQMFYVLGLMNTKISNKLLKMLNPTLNNGAGTIATFPYIFNEIDDFKISSFVKNNIDLEKQDWDYFETSWDFKKHPLI